MTQCWCNLQMPRLHCDMLAWFLCLHWRVHGCIVWVVTMAPLSSIALGGRFPEAWHPPLTASCPVSSQENPARAWYQDGCRLCCYKCRWRGDFQSDTVIQCTGTRKFFGYFDFGWLWWLWYRIPRGVSNRDAPAGIRILPAGWVPSCRIDPTQPVVFEAWRSAHDRTNHACLSCL